MICWPRKSFQRIFFFFFIFRLFIYSFVRKNKKKQNERANGRMDERTYGGRYNVHNKPTINIAKNKFDLRIFFFCDCVCLCFFWVMFPSLSLSLPPDSPPFPLPYVPSSPPFPIPPHDPFRIKKIIWVKAKEKKKCFVFLCFLFSVVRFCFVLKIKT